MFNPNSMKISFFTFLLFPSGSTQEKAILSPNSVVVSTTLHKPSEVKIVFPK